MFHSGCTAAAVFCQGERGCACKTRAATGGVRECGLTCGCASRPDACTNRKLQRGLRTKLRVQSTPGKGFGVFASEQIITGEFVVEYLGELISEAEAQRRAKVCPASAHYHMELPSTAGGSSTRGAGNVIIDAYAVRNIAAFINFSCDPNLDMYRVEGPSGDKSVPRVGFRAIRDIYAGEELGYRRDKNATSERARRKAGQLACGCGAKLCVKFV